MPATKSIIHSPGSLVVLNFQRGPKPRNYLARREQWRLLLLVMLLGVVVMLALEARNPEHFEWLWEVGRGQLVPAVPDSASGESGSGGSAKASSRYFPGVKLPYLDSIRDDEPLRSVEHDAWFHLLEILEKTDQQVLEEHSTGRVTFNQLFSQSKTYRGELVAVRGRLHWVHKLYAPKNDYGIKEYYRVWIQPVDNPHTPMAAWCLHLPEGFPTGVGLSEEVEITGFFFKRWAYLAGDGVRPTPILLARTVRWYRKPVVVKEPKDDAVSLLVVIGGAVAFAALTVWYVYGRTRRGKGFGI